MSEYDAHRRQIRTYKDGPRAEKVNSHQSEMVVIDQPQTRHEALSLRNGTATGYQYKCERVGAGGGGGGVGVSGVGSGTEPLTTPSFSIGYGGG